MNLFGKTDRKTGAQTLTIKISEDYKNELLTEIFNDRIKYYSGRLDEDLTADDIDEIRHNVLNMFNFHIQKSSAKKGIDFPRETKLTLYLARDKEDKSKYLIRNLTNYKISQDTPEDLINPVLETYKKDFSTTVKYCTLGYINKKRKIKSYDE